ncbi:tumor necrosis factor ligand superfamily member 10 [Spea bombifrons]|uniref:tumor necrosis factor ligand superfamily member 10 n=1 Tax=Spea bombifrons TaxID=233779 RepID=UPI00234AEB6A|nr:tumor necrosis factor ligand superfamily member 10 [Spea bombifrons]
MSATSSSPVPPCGIVLIAAVLLQSVFVAVTYIYFTNELKQLRETYTRSNIACLLRDDPEDFFQPADFGNVDSMDPCWEVKIQLQLLIKKIMKKQYKPQPPEQGKLSERISAAISQTQNQGYPKEIAAAHVTGSNWRIPQLRESSVIHKFDGQKIQEWKSHKKPSFLNNFEIEHGELIIKKSGFYFIYSQTYFRMQSGSNSEENIGKQFVQHIYKVTSYPNPILLMKNVKTACWSKNADYALNSIYQGGIFQFYENDRIFVTVSDIGLVDMDERGTFFGAFQLY